MRPGTFHSDGETLGWLQCRHWLFLAQQNSKQPIGGITRYVTFQTARRHEKENVCLIKLKEEKQDSEIFVPFCWKRVVWCLVHFHQTCKASQSLGETSVPISCSVVAFPWEAVVDGPRKHKTGKMFKTCKSWWDKKMFLVLHVTVEKKSPIVNYWMRLSKISWYVSAVVSRRSIISRRRKLTNHDILR